MHPDPRPDGNRRYLLRAYETPDASRLALIMWLAGERTMPRRRIAELWASHRPHDTLPTSYRTIRARIGRGASLMESAGVVRRDGDSITVLDVDRLMMIVRNLKILEKEDGTSIPPGRWARRPEAPAELHDIQRELESKRTAY